MRNHTIGAFSKLSVLLFFVAGNVDIVLVGPENILTRSGDPA